MAEALKPAGVHFVGSLPLTSAKEAFIAVCSAAPGRLLSIPDGETGDRFNYIGWQLECFPQETLRDNLGGIKLETYPKYTLESIKPTKYDDAAISSYQQFLTLRNQGIIPANVRFQVGIPPPINAVQGHTRPEFHEELEPLYEKRMQESLARIVEEIPAQDLAIQWDLCFEIISLELERGRDVGESPGESLFKAFFSPVKEGILERLSRLCASIPSGVHLGFHLCYGDYMHKHFVEPENLEILVDLANAIIETIVKNVHAVEWIHMPVPKDRTDAAYFEPLKDLKLDGSRLYLGVVHPNDEAGTKEKILAAQSVFKEPFGVATECGMGRTPKEELGSILGILKSVTRPWESREA